MDASFVDLMRSRLGAPGVLSGPDVTARSCDPLRHVPTSAAVILRPRSTEEVSMILSECFARGFPVVVHGGLTGVSGGAYTRPDDVVISLELMKTIEPPDVVSRTIVAEAGVTIQKLQETAAAAGLFYPVDLGSRGSATVGGTISTNAGGNRTLRWGMTRDRVLGLEAVLPNGDVVSSMHKLVKNNTGYDVRQFFVGAEGTLGIVTKAVMRLIPQPTSHEVALLSLPDYICVLKLLNAAESMSALSAFELMYGDYYCAVTQSNPDGRPIPDTSQYYVLIETMGYTPGADRSVFEAFLAKAYEDGLATEIVLANSDAQRQSLWAIRESVDIAVRALAPILTYDVSLEVADIDDYVLGIRSALERRFPGWRMIVNGHIGDNNIHIGITTGPDTKEHESEVNDIVYKPLAHLHGSMSAEHGIGTTKNGYLGISRSQEEIGLMRQIKHAIDPSNLLNRKVLFDDEAGGSGKDPRVTPEQFNG